MIYYNEAYFKMNFVFLFFVNLSLLINSVKIKSSQVESLDLLKRISNYEKILEKLKDNEEIIKLLNNSNNLEIEHDLSKFDDNNISKIVNERISETIKNMEYSINKNRNDFKSVLDIVMNYLSNNPETIQVLKKHGKIINEVLSKYFLNEVNRGDLNINSAFLELKSDPDADPPKAYSSSDIPCKSSGDCLGKKLKWMKCTVERVAIRTAYEAANIPVLTMEEMLYKVCSCKHSPKGKEREVKCEKTVGQPGLPCTIPHMVFKNMFKISFDLWKAYQKLSHTCFNPITPYN